LVLGSWFLAFGLSFWLLALRQPVLGDTSRCTGALPGAFFLIRVHPRQSAVGFCFCVPITRDYVAITAITRDLVTWFTLQ
jgi:hypothetical protein